MKKITYILIALSLFILAGCASQEPTKTHDIKTIQSKMKAAKYFDVEKSIISLNNENSIKSDNGLKLTMTGKYINVVGDTFTLKADGTTIGSETQIKRWGVKLNRLAELRDENNTVIGYIGERRLENLFNIGYRFYMYDAQKNEIGHTAQKWLSISDNHTIYNNNDTKAYTIKSKVPSIGSQLHIAVVDNSKIRPEYAIYFGSIVNEITSQKRSRDATVAGMN